MSNAVILKDEPIENFKDDLLGRGIFSRSLADRVISANCEHESQIIGLYGQWGTGKSSIINLMIQHIKEYNDSLSNYPHICVSRYGDSTRLDIGYQDNEIVSEALQNLQHNREEYEKIQAEKEKVLNTAYKFNNQLFSVIKLIRLFTIPLRNFFDFFYFKIRRILAHFYYSFLNFLKKMYYYLSLIFYYSNVTDYYYNAQFQKRNLSHLVIKFEPWNYSGKKELISNFFEQLSLSILKNEPKTVSRKILPLINAYAEIIGTQLESFGIPFLTPLIKHISESKDNNPTLEEQKVKLKKALEKLGHKIIIIIDDIDRLSKSEIVEIFQLVKAVADFPNIVYVLSFDKEIIANALCDMQSIPEINHDSKNIINFDNSIWSGSSKPNICVGYKYIEKMIPIYFEIPEPDKNAMLLILINKLYKAYFNDQNLEISQDTFDDKKFKKLWNYGLKYFFKNIRDVIRFLNTFAFNHHFIPKDVDLYDFLSITAIQTCFPEIYCWIRDNEEFLVSGEKEVMHRDDENNIACTEQTQKIRKERLFALEKCTEELRQISKNNQVSFEKLMDFLTVLFPKLKYWGNFKNESPENAVIMGYYPNYEECDHLKKICGENTFSTYFNLEIPKNVISYQMVHYLSEKREPGDYYTFLQELADKGILDRYFQDLDLDISVINKYNYEMVLRMLFGIEGLVSEYEDKYQVLTSLSHLLYDLLSENSHDVSTSRYGVHSLYEILKYTIKNTSYAECMVPRFMRYLISTENVRVKKVFHENELTKLENVASEYLKIKSKGILENNEFLSNILDDWSYWGNLEDIRKFIKNIKNNEHFVNAMFFAVDRLSGKVDYNKIEKYFEIDQLEKNIGEIKKSNLYGKLSYDEKNMIDIISGYILKKKANLNNNSLYFKDDPVDKFNDEIIKDNLEKNNINDEDIKIWFSESKSDEIILSKPGTLDFSDELLDEKAIEKAIKDRKNDIPAKKMSNVNSYDYKLRYPSKTLECMELGELESKLEHLKEYNKELTLYRIFETFASKINFLIDNASEIPLENTLFTMTVNSNDVTIADEIYEKPEKIQSPFSVSPTYFQKPGDYPTVKKHGENYQISEDLGKIIHHSPYYKSAFKEPLRLFVRNDCEKSEIEIECQINADNLPKPLIKTLKIKVKED